MRKGILLTIVSIFIGFIGNAQTLTLLSPQGGETVAFGDSLPIVWNYTGVTNITLKYSTNNGASYTTIGTFPANTGGFGAYGTYNWFVPSVSSTQCKVKIENAANASLNDFNASNFTITTPGIITVTSPNGGESLSANTYQNITWTQSNLSSAYVNLYYSIDGGTTWTYITYTYASNLTYSWQIPAGTNSTQCRIKIEDYSNASYFDISNANFTITTPAGISLTSPNGGESICAGASTNITWTASQVNNIKIELSTDAGTSWATIAPSISASLGSYNHTFLTTINSNFCYIRISDASNSSISDISNGYFAVQSAIITTSNPYAGQTITSGTYQSIYWNAVSCLTYVNLYYSINNGASWIPIDTTGGIFASSGYYNWLVPNTPSTQCLVKVTNHYWYPTSGQTSGVFTIAAAVPSLILTAPNVGEIWNVGTLQYIQWTSTNIANVKIELSYNGGNTWATLALSYPASTQYYSWTVLNNISTNCKVRVSDASNASLNAISGVFSIVACNPILSISQPYSGQQYTAGSYTYIYWSATCVTNISIEYSSNNGSTWSTAATSTSATTGYYYWAVPATATTQGKIRITDLASGSTATATSGTFIIGTPILTLTTPNGGENWTGGTSHNITWNSTYLNSNYVTLEYSTNNGATWTYINYAYYTGNSGSYNWSVPNTPSTQCKIRVSDYYNSSITDLSNATFTITQATPQISLSSPNGFENWAVGYSYNINWNSISVSNVKLEYTTNGGTTWNTIASSYPANNNSYSWVVPNTPSTNCWVRVSDASNASVTDMSNGAFSITNPTITVTTPNGGEVWQGLTSHYIYWNNTNLGVSTYVNIEYSTNNGSSWNYIVYGAYNNGYYNWNVPNTVSTNCLVRVTDYYNSNVVDVSNAAFTITAAATSLALYAPNGGEVFGVGSTQTISWYSQNISNVKLEYSTDGGLTYPNTIVSSTPNYGYYYWTIPNNVSTQCKVRVSDASASSTQSTSANNFTILAPAVQVTSPNGGQNWVGLSTQNITWSNSAVSNYVTLEYTTNNLNWNYITTVYNNQLNGTYSWTLPNVSTNLAKVRITDYYNAAITDVSDTTFNISFAPAALQVTSPNGFENFAVGSQYYIQWNSTSITTVNLDYSINGGSTWNNIATGINAANSYYLWTVPNTPSTSCLVKVSDANNTLLSDVSNNTFTIIAPYLTITTPNGGEILNSSNNYYIQWNSSGVNNIGIDLSTDGGATYSSIVSNTSNFGYYLWTPSTTQASTQCKIKVKDLASASVINDVSNSNFTIQNPTPSIIVTSPNGGENWIVGSNYYITWNSVAVSSVNIQYSSDNGVTWNNIVSGYSASNSYYSWNIPNDTTSTAWIRVTDASNTSLNDLSGQFHITPNTPTLTITYPNGGENLQVGSYTYISWNSNNVGCTNLEVSYNGGTSWNTLASNLTVNYFYWNIPNIASTQCWVRVTNCYSALTDASNSTFTISVPVANTNTISISSINNTIYCKGDTIVVHYIATGTYNSGNFFSVQMSDASGSFTNPTYIGGITSNALVDSISVTIPSNALNGSGYRVRIVSNNLVATSTNSNTFVIQGPTADFTANPYQNIYLLPQDASIQFVPTTTGSVASYAWTFGDGGTSTANTPNHNYGSTVFFDVQLTVTDSNGCSITAYKPNYIHTEYYLENTDIIPQGYTGTVTGSAFSNTNTGCFTLSNGNCFVTTNGGNNWTNSVTGLPVGTQLTSASLIPGYWVIAGNNGTLCYSTNQGTTWIPYFTGTTATFNAVSMMSSQLGYAVGTGGTICIYNGTTWTPATIAGTNNVTFNSVVSYGTNAIAVGNLGSIYYFNGTTWSAITSSLFNNTFNFTSLYADIDSISNDPIAYVTATNGTICKLQYTNSVWNVTTSLSGTGANFKGISGKGGNVTAVGDSGIVYQSNNGGNSFGRFSIGNTNNLTTVAFKKPRGYIGGVLGTGRSFGPAADTSSTSILKNILMNQISIYPNPVKDIFTISIENNNGENVQIYIKDVTGKIVLEVTNEKLSNNFKKKVDISSLAKGTYFVFINKNGEQVVQKLSID